jgi:hypothetical protein
MFVYTVKTNKTFRTPYIQLSYTTCFSRSGHHHVDFTTYMERIPGCFSKIYLLMA